VNQVYLGASRPLVAGRGARWAIPILGLLLLPWIFYPPVALDIITWGLFAIALDICFGVTGMASFGHALFWGTSAYFAGNLAIALRWPFPLVILVSAIVVALSSIPVAWISVRRVGFYLAMVTLAFAQVAYFLANQLTEYTGGEDGLQRIPKDFFGVNLGDSFTFYYFAMPILALCFLATARIRRSPYGLILQSIRVDAVRAQALGYPVNRYRISAFAISAFFSAVAGALYAISHSFVSLETLQADTSGLVLIMVVLGGVRSQWGPIIGAAIVTVLSDFFAVQNFAFGNTVVGLLFVTAVLACRQGIWGASTQLISEARTRWLNRRSSGGGDPPTEGESAVLPVAVGGDARVALEYGDATNVERPSVRGEDQCG
jgi:branched-chain amino acid transport system permease protein